MRVSSVQKLHPAVAPARWTLDEVAGRFVEVSGASASSALSITFTLIREAQARGEPAAWVTLAEHSFYPPDVARSGVDLAALAVVRLNHPESIARAGEKLLRSGGFGVVVLDLGAGDIPMPLQTRLSGLAHHHHIALICLTAKPHRAFSLGSLVSLRVHAERTGGAAGRFACALQVLKDKRRGPTWNYEASYTGPAGLC